MSFIINKNDWVCKYLLEYFDDDNLKLLYNIYLYIFLKIFFSNVNKCLEKVLDYFMIIKLPQYTQYITNVLFFRIFLLKFYYDII